MIRVRDTGIGIAPEVLPRVFDLFIQARQAIDRSQGGLSLGLTNVRNLIERHRGTVSAHSAGRGQGSEFVVRLPKAALPARRKSGRPSGSHVQPRVDGCRILVVDDNQDGAEMLAAALLGRGYDTRVAHDPAAALRLAAEFTPTFAFLDIGLPVMDGYELAARLRQVPGLASIRLIALTGYG